MKFCDLKIGDEFVFDEENQGSPSDFKRKVSDSRAISSLEGVVSYPYADATVFLIPPAAEAAPAPKPLKFCDLKIGDEFVFDSANRNDPSWIKRKVSSTAAIYTKYGSAVSVDLTDIREVFLAPPAEEAAPEPAFEIVDRPVSADQPELLRSLNQIRFKHFLENRTGRLAATIVTQPLNNVSPGLVAVACAIAHPSDVATRTGGRKAALDKLRRGAFIVLHEDELKAGIFDRSIVGLFGRSGERLAKRLRPRAEFARPVTPGRPNPFQFFDS